ncbi:MAG: 1-acyl-sn-glycerol-3-phosphate acyltransferase [Paracoccaceae bacterium]|jgi:1-acyl-sn-glycerol-3-phosphate acyltransferase
MKQFFDATVGRWLRHFLFVLTRTYYALFYNVSCSNKHLLQDQPGSLVLATHVSRHDGPLIASILYTTTRIRPTVHYKEYYHWTQWFTMFVTAAIPMSSPKDWPDERRLARKQHILEVMHKVLANGSSILLFPAGRIRRQAKEIVEPYLTGTYEVLRAEPTTPVVLLRIEGLGKYQPAKYDHFWSFMGIAKGRRHVSVDIQLIAPLDLTLELAAFNKTLEHLLNTAPK